MFPLDYCISVYYTLFEYKSIYIVYVEDYDTLGYLYMLKITIKDADEKSATFGEHKYIYGINTRFKGRTRINIEGFEQSSKEYEKHDMHKIMNIDEKIWLFYLLKKLHDEGEQYDYSCIDEVPEMFEYLIGRSLVSLVRDLSIKEILEPISRRFKITES